MESDRKLYTICCPICGNPLCTQVSYQCYRECVHYSDEAKDKSSQSCLQKHNLERCGCSYEDIMNELLRLYFCGEIPYEISLHLKDKESIIKLLCDWICRGKNNALYLLKDADFEI